MVLRTIIAPRTSGLDRRSTRDAGSIDRGARQEGLESAPQLAHFFAQRAHFHLELGDAGLEVALGRSLAGARAVGVAGRRCRSGRRGRRAGRELVARAETVRPALVALARLLRLLLDQRRAAA